VRLEYEERNDNKGDGKGSIAERRHEQGTNDHVSDDEHESQNSLDRLEGSDTVNTPSEQAVKKVRTGRKADSSTSKSFLLASADQKKMTAGSSNSVATHGMKRTQVKPSDSANVVQQKPTATDRKSSLSNASNNQLNIKLSKSSVINQNKKLKLVDDDELLENIDDEISSDNDDERSLQSDEIDIMVVPDLDKKQSRSKKKNLNEDFVYEPMQTRNSSETKQPEKKAVVGKQQRTGKGKVHSAYMLTTQEENDVEHYIPIDTNDSDDDDNDTNSYYFNLLRFIENYEMQVEEINGSQSNKKKQYASVSSSAAEGNNGNVDEDEYIFDSGATSHITPNERHLKNKKPYECTIIYGDGGESTSVAIGDFKENDHIEEMIYDPNVERGLLSVAEFEAKGYRIVFENGRVYVQDPQNNFKTLITGTRRGNLYYYDKEQPTDGDSDDDHQVTVEANSGRVEFEVIEEVNSGRILSKEELKINGMFPRNTKSNVLGLNKLEVLHKNIGHGSVEAIKQGIKLNKLIGAKVTHDQIKDLDIPYVLIVREVQASHLLRTANLSKIGRSIFTYILLFICTLTLKGLIL